MYVTAQPQAPTTLVTVNPFRQLHHRWSTGLCNCCDDMGQCKSTKKRRKSFDCESSRDLLRLLCSVLLVLLLGLIGWKNQWIACLVLFRAECARSLSNEDSNGLWHSSEFIRHVIRSNSIVVRSVVHRVMRAMIAARSVAVHSVLHCKCALNWDIMEFETSSSTEGEHIRSNKKWLFSVDWIFISNKHEKSPVPLIVGSTSR